MELFRYLKVYNTSNDILKFLRQSYRSAGYRLWLESNTTISRWLNLFLLTNERKRRTEKIFQHERISIPKLSNGYERNRYKLIQIF